MKRIISIFILILFFDISFGQVFYHLRLGRSSMAIGTGEQNLTLLDPVNAMAGNPANLTYENGATISFFRNPLYFWWGKQQPLSNMVVTFNYDKHYFGLEYSNWELEKAKEIDQYGNIIKEHENYERTFSFGYAHILNEKLTTGVKFTYGISEGYEFKGKHLMLSAGLSYSEKLLGRNLIIGMSFMNFGDRVKLKDKLGKDFFGENPSLFLLGFNYNLLSFYPGNINSLIEFRKVLISHTNGVPDNSFKALFKSWKDFNQFFDTKFGLTLSSNPINVSNRISYGIKYFVGLSTGKYSKGFYNYGMQVSFSYLDYSLGLGFGGRLFSTGSFLSPQIYGYETFDITLNKKINWYNAQKQHLENKSIYAKKLGFAFGISNSLPMGNWAKSYANFNFDETGNFSTYELDLEIQLSDNLFNINTLSYWKSNRKISNDYLQLRFDEVAFAVLSGLGFYPFESLNKLYFSTKVGILRLNPTPANINPKYFNLLIVAFSSGYKFDLFYKGFQIIPYVNLQTFFQESLSKDQLFGLKKFDYGLKLGYEF